MKLIKQHIKSKKSENIFSHIDYLILKRIKSGNLLQENVCDVDVVEFEKLFNISKKMLYTRNITSLMMISTKVIRIEPPNY